MPLPSDPKNKKCINSIRQCILSVFGSVYQNVKFWANSTILFRKTSLKAQNDYIFKFFLGEHGLLGPPLGNFLRTPLTSD